MSWKGLVLASGGFGFGWFWFCWLLAGFGGFSFFLLLIKQLEAV